MVSQSANAFLRCGTKGQRRRYDNCKKALTKLCANGKIDEADKMVLGKFIAHQVRMAFDTGLKIGMTAFLNGARIPDTTSPSVCVRCREPFRNESEFLTKYGPCHYECLTDKERELERLRIGVAERQES